MQRQTSLQRRLKFVRDQTPNPNPIPDPDPTPNRKDEIGQCESGSPQHKQKVKGLKVVEKHSGAMDMSAEAAEDAVNHIRSLITDLKLSRFNMVIEEAPNPNPNPNPVKVQYGYRRGSEGDCGDNGGESRGLGWERCSYQHRRGSQSLEVT